MKYILQNLNIFIEKINYAAHDCVVVSKLSFCFLVNRRNSKGEYIEDFNLVQETAVFEQNFWTWLQNS